MQIYGRILQVWIQKSCRFSEGLSTGYLEVLRLTIQKYPSLQGRGYFYRSASVTGMTGCQANSTSDTEYSFLPQANDIRVARDRNGVEVRQKPDRFTELNRNRWQTEVAPLSATGVHLQQHDTI